MKQVTMWERITNMNNYPGEKIEPLLGQYVAWNMDGTEIIAADPDLEGLFKKLEGVDPETYSVEGLPPRRIPTDPVTGLPL
jgi:hypothetical protein